jgi:hypothetical protein
MQLCVCVILRETTVLYTTKRNNNNIFLCLQLATVESTIEFVLTVLM